jgi:hypothetical protein
VDAAVEGVNRNRGARPVDRVAAGFLLVLLGAGALILWTGVPMASLWVIAELTESSATHFVAAVLAIPVAMFAFLLVLVWINRLYLRVSGMQPDAGRWPVRGPLELFLRWSLFLAAIAFFLWFFLLAENPAACEGR